MSHIIIPVFPTAAFLYDKVLGGVRYNIAFHWNSQDGAWHIEFRNATDTSILVLKVRLVFGVNMFRRTQHIISGTLVVVESNASNHDAPGENDFLKDSPTSVEIRYYEEFYEKIGDIPEDSE